MNGDDPGARAGALADAQDIHAGLDAAWQLYDGQFHPSAREAMTDDADRWRRGIGRAIQHIHQAVEFLTNSNAEAARRSAAARDAALAVGSLDAQLTGIAAHINLMQAAGQVSLPVAGRLTGLINSIKAVVQGISAQILQLISHLVAPVGWAIAGGLGTNLFGLQGTVQIELQFH